MTYNPQGTWKTHLYLQLFFSTTLHPKTCRSQPPNQSMKQMLKRGNKKLLSNQNDFKLIDFDKWLRAMPPLISVILHVCRHPAAWRPPSSVGSNHRAGWSPSVLYSGLKGALLLHDGRRGSTCLLLLITAPPAIFKLVLKARKKRVYKQKKIIPQLLHLLPSGGTGGFCADFNFSFSIQ